MKNLHEKITRYLEHCKFQKNLSSKTLKAYGIDLNQFFSYNDCINDKFSRANILNYISYLHSKYKEKTSKRKIATIKSFFNYLEYEEIWVDNPFSKLKVKSQIPFILPKTIPIHTLNQLFSAAYMHLKKDCTSSYEVQCAQRDIAVLELLFATGLRVSELCSLKRLDLDLTQGIVKVYGKGSKERIIQLTNENTLNALNSYKQHFEAEFFTEEYFFINKLGNQLSEQSVRFMLNRYAKLANIAEHITPHMFRHTFATMLLEEDVDIRYIQQILGHSSILTTQIYTHVTSSKQREILTLKHPRKKINI